MSVNKLRSSSALILVVLIMSAVFASSAFAYPTKTVPCSGCHSGPSVPIVATLASMSGATATYNVSASNAYAIAVFDGSTKLTTILASSGSFSVTPGKTYSVFAVVGPTTSDGFGSTSVSPVAPPVDMTAPVTTSNAASTYLSQASIMLSATDSGSGVAATYYKLDGAAQVAGTSIAVTALGSHTLEFWSVDVAGNAETHKTASFTVTAPVPVPTPVPTPTPTPAPAPTPGVATSTITIGSSARTARLSSRITLSGQLLPGADGETVQLYVMKPGSSTWVLVSAAVTRGSVTFGTEEHESADDSANSASAAWSLRYRFSARGTYKFQARFAGSATSTAAASRIISVSVR